MDSQGAATATTAWAGYLLLHYLHSASRVWAVVATREEQREEFGRLQPRHRLPAGRENPGSREGLGEGAEDVQGPLAGQGHSPGTSPAPLPFWDTWTMEDPSPEPSQTLPTAPSLPQSPQAVSMARTLENARDGVPLSARNCPFVLSHRSCEDKDGLQRERSSRVSCGVTKETLPCWEDALGIWLLLGLALFSPL